MRFVQIKEDVIVNAERIAHMTVETGHPPVTAANVRNPHVHDYPILVITMVDGTVYRIEHYHDVPILSAPFESFIPLLNEITLGVG